MQVKNGPPWWVQCRYTQCNLFTFLSYSTFASLSHIFYPIFLINPRYISTFVRALAAPNPASLAYRVYRSYRTVVKTLVYVTVTWCDLSDLYPLFALCYDTRGYCTVPSHLRWFTYRRCTGHAAHLVCAVSIRLHFCAWFIFHFELNELRGMKVVGGDRVVITSL